MQVRTAIIDEAYAALTTLMLPTITRDTIDLPPGGEVILRYQTWDDYEALLQARQDKAGTRYRRINNAAFSQWCRDGN